MRIGIKVAAKNERNNKDCDTNIGKNSLGKSIPTNKDFEKSGKGNKSNPLNNPIKIEIYIFFSFRDFE